MFSFIDRETEHLYSVLIKLEETTGGFAVTHTPNVGENENADEKTTSELHENSLFIQPERLKVSEVSNLGQEFLYNWEVLKEAFVLKLTFFG